MPFDPVTWLDVADLCCLDAAEVDRQALLRTARNRVYYAALLILKQRIERVQGTGSVPSAGTHQALLAAVSTAGAEFLRISRILERLRQGRNQADYELESGPFPPAAIVKAVELGRHLVTPLIARLPDASFRRLRLADDRPGWR